jgi:transposase
VRPYIAETFGTFALVFAGTGAIVINDVSGGAVTHAGIALTFGLVVLAIIYAVGEVSGAHLNPALTVGFFLARRFPGRRVLFYVVRQCVGALLASGLLHLLFPSNLLTDAAGIPLGLAVDGADRHDRKLFRQTLASIPVERPRPTEEEPQGICLDKAYDFDEVRESADEFEFTKQIKARGEEAQEIKRKAGQKARRWVVERTHSWMNRFRGILIRWNKKAENYIALLHFAFALITFQRC